jgi:hypothetical protein
MNNTKIGISDFTDFMSQGQPEWGVVAIRTHDQHAVEELSKELARPKITVQVPLACYEDLMLSLQESDPEELDGAAAMIPVLRLKGSDWILVFHSIGSYSTEVDELAQSLSSKLKTRCIAFSAEDTSAAMGYAIYENGDRKEKAVLGDTLAFESKERARPNLKDTEDAGMGFLEQVFTENGIYLPACSPLIADTKALIGLQGIQPTAISEAYLLE